MPPERIVANTSALAGHLAARLEREAAAAIAERGRFSIALSGGSVARELYPRLAAADLDVSRCEFFWVDERAVPPEDPDSNFAIAWPLWLKPAGVPSENIHRMRAESPDLEDAACRYAEDLVSTLGGPQGGAARLDVALLGVGPDGHVASLFPGHAALGETRRLVLPVFDSPKPPSLRLTLTLPMLQASRLVVIAAMGREKAPVIRQMDEPSSSLPVAIVARCADRMLVLLDEEAAG